jgi:hypothetical protein
MQQIEHEFVGNQSIQEAMEELLKVLVRSGLISIEDENVNPKEQ